MEESGPSTDLAPAMTAVPVLVGAVLVVLVLVVAVAVVLTANSTYPTAGSSLYVVTHLTLVLAPDHV